MSLCLDNVHLSYPDGRDRVVALDGVTVVVEPGELLAVTGPSGSGKSSLLAVAGLLQRPDTGRVMVDGVNTVSIPGRRRAMLRRTRIGFVFQQSNLLPSLTALDQLLMVAHLAGGARSDSRQRAVELLSGLGLGSELHRRPHQLSGGQRQRVGMARALMSDPAVLLVDEPTSALDAERGRAVVELLAAVTHERKVATVMVTHDVAHLDVVDRTVGLHDGVLL